ncbi:hypothetical protein [Amycolatopsis magusensis]|uniref:hypothetical protein n=1 Tax=Amycolatopsis magusensis TaxID=882444 RepID=UPI0037A80C39
MSDQRLYPLPQTEQDSRFTIGLVLDVADVLTCHGYPAITSGADFVELRQSLFQFLYSPAKGGESS